MTGKPADEIDREAHFADWREQINVHSDNDATFLSYFDTSSSAAEAFSQGQWDFAHHILKPSVIPLIGEPYNAAVLEIGFGGGRLMAASSRYFAHVYGIDIHDQFGRVRRLLSDQGIDNFTLLLGDGRSLPLADNSLDFVYSFIVLQHLPSIDILESYFAEVKRVLKPGKPACLYVGHLAFNWRGLRYIDRGSQQVSSTRENTLMVRPRWTKNLLARAELKLVEIGRARKKPWRPEFGEQHYVIVTA